VLAYDYVERIDAVAKREVLLTEKMKE